MVSRISKSTIIGLTFFSFCMLCITSIIATAYFDRGINSKALMRRRLSEATDLEALIARVEALEANGGSSDLSIDKTWIILAGVCCFFLQAGFGLLEAGAIRAKNLKNIMIKNFLDACIGGLAYFSFGYAFAYGSPGDGTGNEFSGGELTGYFFLLDLPKDEYYIWFFQWVFAAATATIVSGAVAERIQFTAYLVYSVLLTGVIYPWCSHWIWSGDGFLNKLGVQDYAGGGAVHALAGIAAFMGAKALGPRIGRFSETGESTPIDGHSSVLMALGVFILWFGFIPFNAGSGVTILGDFGWITARIACLTALGGCSGGCVGLIVGLYQSRGDVVSLEHTMNGVLCGMVACCSCCGMVEIWAIVFFISPIATVVFYSLQYVLVSWKVDDPLGASSLHWGPGLVGMVANGFFATEEYVDYVYGDSVVGCPYYPWARAGDSCKDYYGIFYGGTGKQLGYQILASLIYTVYGAILCGAMFYGLKYFGYLRISEEDEEFGMDRNHHGGTAYHYNRLESLPVATRREGNQTLEVMTHDL